MTASGGGLRSRLAVPAMYAGGFLGPFGGGVVAAMLPELGGDFAVSGGTASYSLTAYLLPFAAVMLFSGTLGARFGPLRTVRLAYVGYVLVSLGCAFAGQFEVFLACRVLQGAANAFTSPLLLSAVASLAPRQRLGRTLGVFGSLQAAGQTSAPLVGGLAAEVDWRLAFFGVAAVAAVLAVIGLPSRTPVSAGRASLRDAMRPGVLRIGALALIGWACLGGCVFLVSFRAEDDFGFSSGARGALLTVFGVSGILTARLIGRAVDRWGVRRCLLAGLGSGAVLMACVGVLPWVAALAVCWAIAGVSAQLVLVGVNSAVLADDTGGGAVGVVQSFRFFGAAAAPAVFTPVYHPFPAGAFLLAGALLAVAALATLRWAPPRADPAPGGGPPPPGSRTPGGGDPGRGSGAGAPVDAA